MNLGKVMKAQEKLLKDLNYLLHRTKILSKYCGEGINLVMNQSMLTESQHAMNQAAGVAKLTRLAFFYIPLSFTTSLFGMKFVQFGTGIPSYGCGLVFLVQSF